MSEHSHIDKIFKDGLGERNFPNADAMWQRMEADLDKEGGKKRRPLLYLIATAVLLTAGFLTIQHFNTTTPALVAEVPAEQANTVTANHHSTGNVAASDNTTASISKQNIQGNKEGVLNEPLTARKEMPSHGIVKSVKASLAQRAVFTISSAEPDNVISGNETNDLAVEQEGGSYFERMTATAPFASPEEKEYRHIVLSPAIKKGLTKSNIKKRIIREIPKASKVTIEAVAGGDFIRLNRKAGFYAGIRVNKRLENGSSFSVGLNFANHNISDRYRVTTKPAEQRSSDARINTISTVRMPVYLQRQLGTSKFSMMLGLVPTYITKAEVYNVPNSYIGDPDPYRKFDLNDINRFNLLFGGGLRYSPNKWVSLELSGSYGLTGMVKDGYKNLSRVNDNFKSIQLGAAFRLK